MNTKNKTKFFLVAIIVSILLFSQFPIVNAGVLDEVVMSLFLQSSIPPEACIRAIDGRAGNGDIRVEDERGVATSVPLGDFGIDFSLTPEPRCQRNNICRETGSGSVQGDIGDNETYDVFVRWGECTPVDSASGGDGGVISNLRQGLNDLRGIFPSRLQSERGIVNTIGAIIRWVLGIAGAIFVAMIVYGGIQYLTVGTSEKNVEKAKTTITYAVIGMVIIAGAWLIADFVISALIRGA